MDRAILDRQPSRDVAPLLFAAMMIFVVTVVMGILNGTDLVNLSHGAILAHVHSGTLGWITLSVFAGAAWIFPCPHAAAVARRRDRRGSPIRRRVLG